MSVVIGIDNLLEEFDYLLKDKKIALICSSSNVDSKGNLVWRSLKEKSGKNFKEIWSLQHGFFVDKQDNMILSDSFFWEEEKVMIRSFYDHKLFPQKDILEDIDVVVIDIFDVGTRVYTFVNHVLMIMKELSGQKNIEFLICDRANPLGGDILEGNCAKEEYFSIVAQLPIPMRHSLTVAEYLYFGLHYYNIDLPLKVVRCEGLRRSFAYEGHWTYPSPNMGYLETAFVYPGTILLEGTNISEGRGTTKPFLLMGAPYIDSIDVKNKIEKSLGKTSLVEHHFKPEFSKHKGKICHGFLILEPFKEKSFALIYEFIRAVKHLYPQDFSFSSPPYEFEYKRLPFDMINGTDKIRLYLEDNVSYKEIEKEIKSEHEKFIDTVNKYLIYN